MFFRKKSAVVILLVILLQMVSSSLPVFSSFGTNECSELFFDNFNENTGEVGYGPDEYTSMTFENGKLRMIAANGGNSYTSRVCFGLPGDCSLLSSNNYASDKFVIEFEVSGAPIRYGNAMHVGINGKVIGENGMYTDALAPNQLGIHYVVYDRSQHTAFWYTPMGDVISNNSIYEDSVGENSGFWFYIQGTNTSSSGYELDYVAVYTLPEEFDFEIRESEPGAVTLMSNAPISLDTAEFKLKGEDRNIEVSKIADSYNLYSIAISPFLDFGTEYSLETALKRVWDDSLSSCERIFRTRDKRIFVDIKSPEFEALEGTVDIEFEINDETGTSPAALALFTVRGSDRMLRYILAQDIILTTGTLPLQVTLPAISDGDVFEVVVFDSLRTMKQTGNKISVSSAGIKKEEYIPKSSEAEASLEITVDNEKLTAEFAVTLDENSPDSRVSVIVLKEGTNVISADNIYWFDQVDTRDKKAVIKVLMPDKTAVYNVYHSVEGGEAKGDTFEVFDSNFVPDALAAYNGDDIKSSAQKYEKGLNLSHSEISGILEDDFFMAVLEIRKESFENEFENVEELKKAYEQAKLITLKSENFVSEYNTEYGFDPVAYNVYDTVLSDIAKKSVSEELTDSKTYNLGSVFEKFTELVVLEGIEHSEHYSQTVQIIAKLSGIIGMDMTLYNTLRSPFEVCVGLTGKSYENYSALIAGFNVLVAEEKGKETSYIPSGNSGGGGGGSAGPSRIEVKPEEPLKEKEEKPYFSDTENVKWAQEAIESLYKQGIVSGKAENKFFPGDLLTREETAKIISLAYNLEASGKKVEFKDVSSKNWSYPYINTLASLGIMRGMSDEEFGNTVPLTREMLATVIYRVNGCPEISKTEEFADMKDVSLFAYDAVLYLKSIGIVKGTGNGNFEPGRFCTRAEAAKMIYESMKGRDL